MTLSHAIRLAASASLLSIASARQIPTFDAFPIDLSALGPDVQAIDVTEFRAGADKGCVAVVEPHGPGAPNARVIVGRIDSVGNEPARVLRVPSTIDGVTQFRVMWPTLADGHLAYLAEEAGPSGTTWAAWWDDERIAGPGDRAGEDGRVWAGVSRAYATTRGSIIVHGEVFTPNPQFTRPRIVEYFPGTSIGITRLRTGAPLIGTTWNVTDIIWDTVSVSSDGAHVAAIVRTTGGRAIAVNQAVHTSFSGSAIVAEGASAGDFFPFPSSTEWLGFEWVNVNSAGDVIFWGSYADFTSGFGGEGYFRSGRQSRLSDSIGISECPDGLDDRGFLLRACEFVFPDSTGLEATPIHAAPPYLDLDHDGVSEFGAVLIPIQLPYAGSRSVEMSGDGFVHAVAGVLPPNGAPGQYMVLRNTHTLGNSAICRAEPNSFGRGARVQATGSDVVAYNRFTLTALGLPPQAWTIPLFSQGPVGTPLPAGDTRLCLGAAVARAPWLGRSATPDGRMSVEALLNHLPIPGGIASATAGDVWNVQLWYRDADQGVPVSRFSDAVAVSFR